MEAQSKHPNFELRVGLFTLIAAIILSLGWSWLKGFSLHPPQRFTVKFHDIAGLTTNAPVNVNGVRVGTVEKIELKGKGQVYCCLKITTEDLVIPQGSSITIQTLGLVGAKYVEITLPEVDPNEPAPAEILPGSMVVGQDPVRVELYVNKIATNMGNFTDAIGSKEAQLSISRAAQTSGAAMENIKDAAVKFNKNMDKLAQATDSINTTANRFTKGANSASNFFDQGTSTLRKVSGLTQDLSRTSHKLDKILDNPTLSSDLKQTAQLAKETAEKIQTAIHELNTTVNDKPIREDLMNMLNKLANSTENIYHSMQIVRAVGNDQGLRADIKSVLADARSAMEKANVVLGNDTFISDARQTMAKLRNAADQVDLASQNINQVLTRKHLFFHLLFGKGVAKTVTIDNGQNGKPTKVKVEDSSTTPKNNPKNNKDASSYRIKVDDTYQQVGRELPVPVSPTTTSPVTTGSAIVSPITAQPTP